eukprot:TRINITY_DN11145_c0_g1_i1.p1 TRINITY_DN11145_c0_g1~~TRINITY_DN11145_c0_g1_i1.p1  ORF type:complete len:235 (+),score=30.82 TRINITY_DN11145_c0_g1_i1:81-785(+)
MTKGKLQVSIIEARNVEGDQEHSQDYYVKLKVGVAEAKTDISQGSSSPKFLKDVRMEVVDVETDTLRVEILQVGPRGDLVIGTHERLVKSFLSSTTHVGWFKLVDATQEVTAEVCMVVRFQPAEQTAPDKVKDEETIRSGQITPKKSAIQKKNLKGQKVQKPMPMPLAIALGVLVGALGYLYSKRPKYYEVKEGDTLCSIGICFNRNYRQIAESNQEIIDDPNLIYPGDRIKIM